MENKDKILSIALKLFAARGYDAVGIQEIVDAAGVTKPTLYHYFRNKRGLLDKVLEVNYEDLFSKVSYAAKYKGDLPATLTLLTRTFFEFARSNREFYRMQLSMCFSSPGSESFAAVLKHNEKLIGLLEEMFISASKDHGNMKNRHKRYAFTFLGMLNNYITLYLNNYAELTDDMVYQSVHQFSHGIYS